MWYEPHQFPFMAEIAKSWRTIKSEVERLGPEHFEPWGQTHMYQPPGGWQICPLFVDLYTTIAPRCESMRKLCPKTTELVSSVRGMTAAGFSALLPGTTIIPHPGLERGALRSHLGIVVPQGDCACRVGDEVRRWADGAWLVFDDVTDHEAWNRTASIRIVMMLDFKKSVYGIPERDPGT